MQTVEKGKQKMNEKRVIKIAFEVTDNFELQLQDVRKMLSNKYKNDFFI